MSDRQTVIGIIRATLLSCKGSVSVKQCNRDYKELQGEWIPYKEIGYKTLEDLFKDVPGFRVTTGYNGEMQVDAIVSEETSHIAEMISRQKSHVPKRFTKFAKPPPRRLQSGPSWRPDLWKNRSPPRVSSAYKKPQPMNREYRSRNNEDYSRVMPTAPRPFVRGNETNKVFPPAKPEVGMQNGSKRVIQMSVSKNVPAEQENIKIQVPLPQRLSAASRLSAAQIKLKSMDLSTKNKTNDTAKSPEIIETSQNIQDSLLSPMGKLNLKDEKLATEIEFGNTHVNKPARPSFLNSTAKDNISRLLLCCHEMGLPDPVYKSHEQTRKGRMPSTFDCTVKCGTKYLFSTYPDSMNSKELAMERVAGLALAQLEKAFLEADNQPFSTPSAAVQRIVSIVSTHPNGIWADTLPDMYKELHNEKLPVDWLRLIDDCDSVSIEKGANGLSIILPYDPSIMKLEPSYISDNRLETVPHSQKCLYAPPTLQYPEESLWSVYVMGALSTVEVWLRIIGENYSDVFEEMINEMETYFLTANCDPVSEVVEGGWYALNCQEEWLRVRVLQVSSPTNSAGSTALCFLADNGDEETHPLTSLFHLPQQFASLPPQAILCRLGGLEEYSTSSVARRNQLSDMIVRKVLVAEILQGPEEMELGDDPTITIVLYDTTTDVDLNVNKELLRRITQEACVPQLSIDVSEVYVSDINSRGQLCIQIHNESWRLLQHMLQQFASGSFPKVTLHASFGPLSPMPGVYYLVKSKTGEWLRAVLRSGVSDGRRGNESVLVRYIDCGRTEKVPVKDVLLLERISDALNKFPVQSLQVQLHNVTNLNNDQLERLNNLLPKDEPVLCKMVSPGSNVVEIFVRTEPKNFLCNVNNAINLEKELANKTSTRVEPLTDFKAALTEKKMRIFSKSVSSSQLNTVNVTVPQPKTNTIPQLKLPEKGNFFNVQISLAANPWNFTVQPLDRVNDLNQMMSDLQTSCEKLPFETIKPVVGHFYAAFYEADNLWYRGCALGVVSHTMVSIHFIDFGDIQMVEVGKLKQLPATAKTLPALAIKARLHGVLPINSDWSVEDCLRFRELTVDQKFVSIIKEIQPDPIQTNETLLTLTLIDTTTDNDLYLSVLLQREDRAKLTD